MYSLLSMVIMPEPHEEQCFDSWDFMVSLYGNTCCMYVMYMGLWSIELIFCYAAYAFGVYTVTYAALNI